MDTTKTVKNSTNSLASTTSNSTDKMNYALQVALQTMKERCIQLQRRVSNMEEENQRLREATIGSSSANGSSQEKTDCSNDVSSLRSQLDELQRQKEQLEDQISMVSNENRRLWSHLSKISKDQQHESKDDEVAMPARCSGKVSIGANQNLIRSKTFTQHSPNPHLRQKMITEVSLEEIPLDEFDGSEVELGYPCGLNVDDPNTVNELDTNFDAKQCMEGLQDLRREAMKQQQELSSALSQLETRIAMHPCPECVRKAANKPEMADKSLETEDNTEPKRYSINGHSTSVVPAPRLNFIQEKLKADAIDKTCPMCGKLYSSQVSFKAFQEHVEMHFIDDALDADGSMERQFEFVSHAVGDF
ncbi:protein spindle-F isoform X2 [Drosophila navojoa]|uniref:protein spindle-F isoform X2 n=1 Tax=Drosophila navojoa TaxID=7232 RepID=UPI0011BE9E4A|nr:protein spindle-F isoform X2 [Drosophila navojoa]